MFGILLQVPTPPSPSSKGCATAATAATASPASDGGPDMAAWPFALTEGSFCWARAALLRTCRTCFLPLYASSLVLEALHGQWGGGRGGPEMDLHGYGIVQVASSCTDGPSSCAWQLAPRHCITDHDRYKRHALLETWPAPSPDESCNLPVTLQCPQSILNTTP